MPLFPFVAFSSFFFIFRCFLYFQWPHSHTIREQNPAPTAAFRVRNGHFSPGLCCGGPANTSAQRLPGAVKFAARSSPLWDEPRTDAGRRLPPRYGRWPAAYGFSRRGRILGAVSFGEGRGLEEAEGFSDFCVAVVLVGTAPWRALGALSFRRICPGFLPLLASVTSVQGPRRM